MLMPMHYKLDMTLRDLEFSFKININGKSTDLKKQALIRRYFHTLRLDHFNFYVLVYL
jgi:hypothetical protein